MVGLGASSEDPCLSHNSQILGGLGRWALSGRARRLLAWAVWEWRRWGCVVRGCRTVEAWRPTAECPSPVPVPVQWASTQPLREPDWWLVRAARIWGWWQWLTCGRDGGTVYCVAAPAVYMGYGKNCKIAVQSAGYVLFGGVCVPCCRARPLWPMGVPSTKIVSRSRERERERSHHSVMHHHHRGAP